MQYGNCFLGAITLLWLKRKEKPNFIIRFRPESCVPHFMIKTTKKIYHYKLNKNLLPWPFCYFFFQGSFQKLELEKEILFINEKNKIKWVLSIALILGIFLSIAMN